MTEQDVTTALEVARTADECTLAARAAEFTQLRALIEGSAHREELVAMWGRLLVTAVPEDMAAELIDQLWRHDDSRWLIAVEYFLDYAQRRDPASLGRFAAEVTSWPGAGQAAFARVVLTTIACALPDGIVPSTYLVARGLLIEAAQLFGSPELVDPLAGLVALGWRQGGFPAARLAFDLARHVERELPGAEPRRQAIMVLALVAGTYREPDEPVFVSLREGIRRLGDGDDPVLQANEADKATVVAARVVRLAGYGDLRGIEAELDAHAPGAQELVPVLLALALAVASQVRDEAAARN
ncbi:hypothetical protein GCM10017788_23220 [Amycolatopsis acidiphila]|nr:hypothetical protein GCM10017788_23220 [Amycolatopsis acidiphila]